jgi:hypothetical protein
MIVAAPMVAAALTTEKRRLMKLLKRHMVINQIGLIMDAFNFCLKSGH